MDKLFRWNMCKTIKNELKTMFTEHWKYLTLAAACKLNLFDILETAPLNTHEIARKLNVDYVVLRQLLNALANIEYLYFEGDKYCLSEKSKILTENNPESLKYACIHWATEPLNAWQNLDYSIKEGKSAFEYLFGENYFKYLDKHLDRLEEYHKAMYEYALDDYKNLPNIIDFGRHKIVLDCGGGYGAAIGTIKNKYPNVRCILFDRPNVVEKAKCQNVECVGGDFLENIPINADAIILSRILHDWDDAKASLILAKINKSIDCNGNLYVIENCTEKIEDISFLSLNMFAICNSYERTTVEYINLCESQGFVFVEQKKLNNLQTILIFKK